MSDEEALLAAIWEYPHDDTPRLVYADWLQEYGDPAQVARAEFIRLQCRLARMEIRETQRYEAEERPRQLLIAHEKEWTRNAPGCVRRIRASLGYDRGFPHPKRELSTHMFRHTTADDWSAAPLWGLRLAITHSRERELGRACLESPHLFRISRLTLKSSVGWRERGWQRDDIRTLAHSPFGRNVTHLMLDDNAIGPEAVAAIADPSAFPHLSKLSLRACGVTAESLALLAAAPLAKRFKVLTMRENWFGDAGLRVLAGLPPFPALRELCVGQNGATEAGYVALAGWSGLATLDWLDVGIGPEPGFTPTAARALADSPHLARLSCLRYPRAGLGNEVRPIIQQRFKQACEH